MGLLRKKYWLPPVIIQIFDGLFMKSTIQLGEKPPLWNLMRPEVGVRGLVDTVSRKNLGWSDGPSNRGPILDLCGTVVDGSG